MTPETRFTSPLCFKALYEGDTVWFVPNSHYPI